MAIHELDDSLADGDGYETARPVRLDPEQTAVRIDIPTRSGGVIMSHATVHHHGDRPVHVVLPPHFRDYAEAAGIDRFDEDFEAFLWVLAKMAFARGGR